MTSVHAPTREAFVIAMKLGPPERQLLALLRARKSDKQIRAIMVLGMGEALQLSHSLRTALGGTVDQTIVERADQLGIKFTEEP